MSEVKVFYKCLQCGCIHIKKVAKCEGCTEIDFEEKEKLEIDDIVNLIRDYAWRCKDNVSGDTVDYWYVFEYVQEIIGEEVYSNFDKALKVAKEKGIAEKHETIFFPD